MARTAQHTPLLWLNEGLHILEAHGRDALTLENLARKLGATKGSFYHHFTDLAEYRARLLVHFEYESTHKVIADGEQKANPKIAPELVLESIVLQAANNQNRAEVIFRAWALEDADVRAMIARIDQARIQYGYQLFYSITKSKSKARSMIQVLYALLLGAEQLDWGGSGTYYASVFKEFKKLYQISK